MMAKYQLLDNDTCDRLVEKLQEAKWKPGASPSAEYSESIKRNLEIEPGDNSEIDMLFTGVVDSLMRCEFFVQRTMPKHIGSSRFNSYLDGGEYCKHADSAFMGTPSEIRTDISITIFLSDPNDYEGGELILEYPSGAVMSLKEPKGMMVFYPSGVMHHVRPVTGGNRIAFVTWVESHIQEQQKRDILVEITNVCNEMKDINHLSDIHVKMMNIKHNLFRQWMKNA